MVLPLMVGLGYVGKPFLGLKIQICHFVVLSFWNVVPLLNLKTQLGVQFVRVQPNPNPTELNSSFYNLGWAWQNEKNNNNK